MRQTVAGATTTHELDEHVARLHRAPAGAPTRATVPSNGRASPGAPSSSPRAAGAGCRPAPRRPPSRRPAAPCPASARPAGRAPRRRRPAARGPARRPCRAARRGTRYERPSLHTCSAPSSPRATRRPCSTRRQRRRASGRPTGSGPSRGRRRRRPPRAPRPAARRVGAGCQRSLEEPGRDRAAAQLVVAHQPAQERQVRRHPEHHRLVERRGEPGERVLARSRRGRSAWRSSGRSAGPTTSPASTPASTRMPGPGGQLQPQHAAGLAAGSRRRRPRRTAAPRRRGRAARRSAWRSSSAAPAAISICAAHQVDRR